MNMTIEQALQILDQAASRAMLSREDHVKVQMAIETLTKELQNSKEVKAEYDNPK